MTDAEVKAVSERVLLDLLGGDVFERSSVNSGPDHDGDQSLFVIARLKPGSKVVGGRIAGDAMVALGGALEARGETRFPYLSFDYPDDESLSEPELEQASE